MRGRRIVSAALVGGLVVVAGGRVMASPQGTVGMAVDYQTGDYGSGQTTDAWAVTLTVSVRPKDRWALDVSIPYLYQSASTTTTAGGMRFDVSSDGRTSISTMGSGHRERGAGNVATVTDSQSGLGDVVVGVGYTLIEESDDLPQISLSSAVKIPTADEEKNLGTGEWDLEVGMGLAKIVGGWDVFASGRYVFQGESEAFGLKDFTVLEAGLGRFVGEAAELWASAAWASAPSEFSDPSAEMRLGIDFGLPSGLDLGGYVSKGLTDGAPDYGAGVSASVAF
ncbi:MAG: DUF3187 family protein [Deltaproteobacteria bacterium]|nr:DUF3187 family protein [Deltaproteobacteria bacterium]